MLHQDNLAEAMEVFIRQLPHPDLTSTATIENEFQIQGKKVKLIAQKNKGLNGTTWRINLKGLTIVSDNNFHLN